MKLSEKFFNIIDDYRSIINKLRSIIYYMQPFNEDIDIEIKQFFKIVCNKDEVKTMRVCYNIWEDGTEPDARESDIPIEWLDLDYEELKLTIKKYLYEKEIKKKQLEAEANEARDRREYERLKKKYEGN